MGGNTHQFTDKKLLLIDKIGYGSGNLGFGFVLQIITSFLVFYSTAVLNLPGSLVGLVISISVVWDALSDPVMGHVSDKTNISIFGRRHLYILIGVFGIAIFNYLLWIISPSLPTTIKFIWIFVIIVLVKTFMTIFITPYTALGAELSYDYHERTSIQSIKTSFFLLGLFFGAALGLFLFFQPTAEFPVGQLNPNAYKYMGITSSLLMLLFGLVSFFTTIKYVPYMRSNQQKHHKKQNFSNIFKSFVEAIKNKNYRAVVFGYLFTNISAALIGTIGLHIFTYTFFMGSSKIGIILGVQLIVSILSQPIWTILSKKMEKKPAVMLGLWISIFGSVIFIVLVLLKTIVIENYLYFLPFSIFAGFGTGALYTIPLSMIADTTDEEELRSGFRKEGVYFGGMTFGYKLSQSVSIFLLGILLDLINFDATQRVQSEFVVNILGLILPIGSIISFGLGIYFYRSYSLTEKKIQKIQLQLELNQNPK